MKDSTVAVMQKRTRKSDASRKKTHRKGKQENKNNCTFPKNCLSVELTEKQQEFLKAGQATYVNQGNAERRQRRTVQRMGKA